MMADLYGDLDTSVDGRSSIHLKKELQVVQAQYDKLQKDAANLQRLNQELADQNAVLETNLSVVFATAQTEIARKDKTINELREELHRASRSGDAPSSPLEAAFVAACDDPKQKEKFDMTEKEQQSFLKAMKDPDFRSLLNEYMHEISDPAHRAEQELYLRQLENENKVPTDKQLVLPKPGFVLKTKYKQRKIFVNVCSSDKMQPPSSTRVASTPSTAGGTSWNLPYCVGPQRLEPDKGGKAIATFDVCYHPQTISRAMESAAFMKMLVNTALDGVDKVFHTLDVDPSKVDREYHILKGIAYKSGNPVTMCIAAAPATPPSRAAPSTLPSIAYQITHRGQFDLADHIESREAKSFRPRDLVVRMTLPTHTSAAGIDLDVSVTAVRVTAAGYAPLAIDLPFSVVEASGKAKFDKATKTLIVTLPVVAPPVIVYTQVERASVHETRTHISHVVPVAHINATTLSSVDDGSATLFRFQAGSTWFEYRLDHLKQQQQGGENCAAVLDWTVEVATQNLAIICRKAAPPPKVPSIRVHRVSSDMFSILVDVANVDQASVTSSFTSRGFVLAFSATSGETSDKFELIRSFQHDLVPAKCLVQVADENLLVVLAVADPHGDYFDLVAENVAETTVVVTADSSGATTFNVHKNTAPEPPATIALPDETLQPPLQVPRFTNDLMYELD
ncbi:hypothetical protein B5M09_006935 [Aphanomyces astaci]|uniref:PIH1 domain-containing protein 1 n=1 Tax=Aphanomyces astaci TaxID=112090 RepID=A0A425DEQ7_APHAT|nr:hypothetical protein B5M09_006935 [Aphanomyces astaci]